MEPLFLNGGGETDFCKKKIVVLGFESSLLYLYESLISRFSHRILHRLTLSQARNEDVTFTVGPPTDWLISLIVFSFVLVKEF